MDGARELKAWTLDLTYKGETRLLENSVPSQGLHETFKALKGGEGG